MNIPKHIFDAISNNETSLFNHEALNNDYVRNSLIRSISEIFNLIESKTECGLSIKENTRKLNELLSECKSIESGIKEDLIKIINDYLRNVLFPNLDTHINLELDLMDEPKQQTEPQIGNDYSEFRFEDFNEIDGITKYIYKRRMMNVLITGLALYYSNDYKWFVQQIFELNTKLPHLYSEINLYNTKLLYLYDESSVEYESLSDGYYDIWFNQGGEEAKPLLKVSGYTFSSLLYETIKGILNKTIFNSLPNKPELIHYILERTDSPMFEYYDMRIGHPLATSFVSILEKNGCGLEELNLGFTMQYLMALPDEEFNSLFKELLASTLSGETKLMNIVEDIKLATSIVQELGQEEEYFTVEELENEEEVLNEDLHKKTGSSQSKSIATKRKWVTSRLKASEGEKTDDKYSHSTLSYRLYPDMDKDTARSLFSKKARGVRKFDDEEIKKLYSAMKKGS